MALKEKIYGTLVVCFFFIGIHGGMSQRMHRYGFHEKDWLVEAQVPDSTFLEWKDDQLVVDSKAGTTIWFKSKLSGHYTIEYDRQFLFSDVHYPRLSDLNQFWAALSKTGLAPFGKNGSLEAYNGLVLYYMGFGGNSNSTTRFRRYDGSGNRILLKEFLDEKFLLQKDKLYHVKTEVNGPRTRVWIDDQLLFDYTDRTDIPAGYFGLRLTWSAQQVSHFTVTTF
ncbi:MAG: DUF6250 domain-containing protein [Chitinophagaceae bacterium]